MMKTLIIILTFLFSVSVAYAKDIQLFNPELFGKPTTQAVKLLYEKKSDEIEPYVVSTDIKCGKYYAATVYYSNKKVTFSEVRDSIKNNYKDLEENLSLFQESKFAIWRNNKSGYTIQLAQECESITVIYLQFQPMKTLMNTLMKMNGAKIDAHFDEDCK